MKTVNKMISVCSWLLLVRKGLLPSLLVLIALLLGANNAWSDDSIQLLRIIPIPGFSDATHAASFDIGWTDRGKYYFADRGPFALAPGYEDGGHVNIIDAIHDEFEGSIGGFCGNNGCTIAEGTKVSGPNGILVLHRHGRRELWAGDGNATVKVVDLDTLAMDTIDVGACPPFPCGTMRADELAYDSINHIIMIANDRAVDNFVTFISQKTHEVLGKLAYDGSDPNTPKATDGLEQPVFDKSTGKFYFAVPATEDNKGGEIDEIDPLAMQVTRRFPLEDCVPHGLALGPRNDNGGHNLLVGCSKVTPTRAVSIVMDDTNGAIVAPIEQVGGSDEVWFNAGDNRYYLAASNCGSFCGGPVLGVIDAETNEWIGNVATATGAHSVAVNRRNNHIFVPRGPLGFPADEVGVAVYGPGDESLVRKN